MNNAGRSQRSTFLSCDLQVDRDLFELDYFAQVSLTRVVANQMVDSGLKGGQIVFVTSVAKTGMLVTSFGIEITHLVVIIKLYNSGVLM